METKEIWKDIEGYEGLYQVSNLGRIKSLNFKRSGKEGILKSNPEGGYCAVTLSHKRRGVFYIHRLVATAFIPNPENKPEVNHINHNKRDNRASNLEWVTQSENCTAYLKSQKRKDVIAEQQRRLEEYYRKKYNN
jgi:hypothetical protein